MSNGLIDLEDAMYLLYKRFYPNGKAVRIGFDALPSHTISLVSRFPEATAHLLASSAYRLTRRVFSQPFTIEQHTPRSMLTLRPARSHTYTFTSQQDLALAIQTTIISNTNLQILDQLANLTFQTINQPSLQGDLNDLRTHTESVALSVHEHIRSRVQTPSPCRFSHFLAGKKKPTA
ncbi:hypothetical protein [Pseudomonas ficuserectae]|uniref:hypothetical protein n=1 Tax=Pseudomonas ficuserectae TaxID=53410 RepID=UPI0006D62674|nr:hypothetical protein [Pseudomonas ficuserectae]KPX25801.1 hypothetical protein ALO69_200049 [Pseudomonas ficuserectae]RMS31602.1 hypothetical protein ALP68_03347 [Pseudomonas ficuserectae]RMS32293.1 hypothetical protein ALP67_03536 [Pseudomonas ficuserectae]